MIIRPTSAAGAVSNASGAGPRSGATFSVASRPSGPQASAPSIATAPASLLLLQEVDPSGDRRRARDQKARRHGARMLDLLARLQAGLLTAGDGPDSELLQSLETLSRQAPEADDPALQGVLDAIAVRAAVERARHMPQGVMPRNIISP